MTKAGRPWLGGLALLGAALVLSLLPGGTTGGASGAILALILPGYALLICLGTPARLDGLSDLLECVAASLAITPLALRLAGTILPFDRLHVIGVLAGVASGLLVLGALRPRPAVAPSRRRIPPAVFAIVIATLLLLAPTLAIGPTPDGGETRVKGWDLNNHLAIAESIATRGLPPLNPFLASDSPFYYHTFLHILLGAMLVLAGEGAHSYLLISLLTLLLAAVFLVTFYRAVSEITGDDRIALLALPLVSLVGGFDLVPMAVKALFEKDGIHFPVTFILRHWNVDGWVSNRGMLVPSFFASFYWVPHAIAAVVVLLLALLYLSRTAGGTGTLVTAAVCLASMAGYNGYVALGGAATLILLRGLDAVRFFVSGFRAGRDALLRGVLVAGFAILLSLPVLSLYVGQRGDIDKFRWVRPTPMVPLQIFVEFGPALILGLLGLAMSWRREAGRDRLSPFLLMGVVSLPLLCFVASTGENNDLAMRMSLFLWIGLAVLSGVALSRFFPAFPGHAPMNRTARIGSLAALALGSLSVAWFAVGAAVAKPALPADEVAAGRWIRTHVASGGLVQGSPLRNNPELVYLSGHPAVLSDTWAGELFYADPNDFARRMASLREAFSDPDATRACSILRSLKVAALVVGPPERRDFPILLLPAPWPCLAEGYQRGTYRVYRLVP